MYPEIHLQMSAAFAELPGQWHLQRCDSAGQKTPPWPLQMAEQAVTWLWPI
jgi:hypothetical protein